MTLALTILILHSALLLSFSYFAFFNFLYGLASLRRPRLPRVPIRGERVAVVIVSYNEKHVLEATIRAAEELTYDNKLLVVADDSTDPALVHTLRNLARARGCRRLPPVAGAAAGAPPGADPEVWESPDFVLLRRNHNRGAKAGSLQEVLRFLTSRDIHLLYVLDADWHPQPDAIERTLEVLQSDSSLAFVQTRRLTHRKGMSLFQRYVAINEEGCYYVDLEGRQVLGHPILFTGCCALLRIESIQAVGGFTAGHLTEDLDLSVRLWIGGWRGAYLSAVVNHGEVPFNYEDFRRQQERWVAGSARVLRRYWKAILLSPHLRIIDKLSALRQVGYFTTSLLTSVAILVVLASMAWITLGWNSYPVETYLLKLERGQQLLTTTVLLALASTFVEPVVMIVIKQRRVLDLVHAMVSIWYVWSMLGTLTWANLKGLLDVRMTWFVTPKFERGSALASRAQTSPRAIRVVNAVLALVMMSFYFLETFTLGWRDVFCLLWVPAFLLGVRR